MDGFLMSWKCGCLRHGLEVSFPSSLEGFLTALARSGLVLRTEAEAKKMILFIQRMGIFLSPSGEEPKRMPYKRSGHH